MSTQTKPPWDESLPGKHPAFRPPTKKEIKEARKVLEEARLLSTGLGSGEMTRRQRWLESARSRENLHRLNFEFFLAAPAKFVGGRKRKTEQTRIHRYGLVAALRDLGRFDEALEIAASKTGGARPGFKQLADEVFEWGMAVARKDEALDICGCERPVHSIEVSARKSVEIAVPRRNAVAWLFSIPHGKVIDLWRCSGCGLLNAHDLGPPEAQADLHELRRQAELAERGRKGRSAPALEETRDDVLFKRP